MKITIHLKDKLTGASGIVNSEWYKDLSEEDAEYYVWFSFSENNYSCDCNRCLLLYRDALGDADFDGDKNEFNCISNRIVVEKIINNRTGKIIYEDVTKEAGVAG